MAVVVDASTIAAIAFGEPPGPTLAAHLAGETLLAPALIDYELASIALKKIRRRPETLAAIAAALGAALRLPITRVSVPSLDVLALAVGTRLSTYAASYLWLAASRDAELVTLDERLALAEISPASARKARGRS